MPTISVKDIDLGSIVTFRSKNANDTVLWKGTLESTGTYRAIRSIIDPRAYNEAVRQVDSDVPSDVTVLSYFTITVDNDATSPTTLAFAEEWVEPGSLSVIDLNNKVTLQIDDPFNNVTQILSILANAGYTSKVINS